MSSCFPSIVFCHTYHLLCKVCSYVNVIFSSFYCLLSRLALVTLSFSYVNVILSSLYCLLSYLSLVMLSFLLCECHLVFLSIVFCHTYHIVMLSFVSYVNVTFLLCECHLVFPLLSFVILITCYVKFSPM